VFTTLNIIFSVVKFHFDHVLHLILWDSTTPFISLWIVVGFLFILLKLCYLLLQQSAHNNIERRTNDWIIICSKVVNWLVLENIWRQILAFLVDAIVGFLQNLGIHISFFSYNFRWIKYLASLIYDIICQQVTRAYLERNTTRGPNLKVLATFLRQYQKYQKVWSNHWTPKILVWNDLQLPRMIGQVVGTQVGTSGWILMVPSLNLHLINFVRSRGFIWSSCILIRISKVCNSRNFSSWVALDVVL